LILIFFGSVTVVVEPSQSPSAQRTFIEPRDDLDAFVGMVKTIHVEIEEHEFTTHFMDFGNRYKRTPFQTSQFGRDGKKLEGFQYRTDGVPLPKTTYSYDGRGLLLKEHHFSAVSGKPYLQTSYFYDSEGRVKEVTGENLETNKVLNRKIYTHDEKKNYTEITEHSVIRDVPEKLGIVWNSDGQAGEVIGFFPRCNGECKIKFSYDAKGRAVEVTPTGIPEVKKENYRYEDDEQGNWIKKTRYHWVTENGKSFYKLIDITYRKLTYY